MKKLLWIGLVSLFMPVLTTAQSTRVKYQLEPVFPDAYALYLDLHQHPELSSHETRTAALLAQWPHQFGYEVTENVGGTGVVATLLLPRAVSSVAARWRVRMGSLPNR